jgi:hypothetical protein
VAGGRRAKLTRGDAIAYRAVLFAAGIKR